METTGSLRRGLGWALMVILILLIIYGVTRPERRSLLPTEVKTFKSGQRTYQA